MRQRSSSITYSKKPGPRKAVDAEPAAEYACDWSLPKTRPPAGPRPSTDISFHVAPWSSDTTALVTSADRDGAASSTVA